MEPIILVMHCGISVSKTSLAYLVRHDEMPENYCRSHGSRSGVIIPPATKLGGGGILESSCPSVRPSVRPSVDARAVR